MFHSSDICRYLKLSGCFQTLRISDGGFWITREISFKSSPERLSLDSVGFGPNQTRPRAKTPKECCKMVALM